jgi:hypothetical protein
LLDPSQAVNSSLFFTNIDPTTGAAPTSQIQLVGGVSTAVTTGQYSNQMTDFDNEYVWHCHILGHEEQDFMRPFVFHPNVLVPDAPAAVTVSGSTVTWTDTTPVGGQDAQGIPTAGTNAAYPSPTSSPKNEIGYKIYFAPTLNANGFVTLPATPDALVSANVTSYTAAAALPATTVVVAYNAAGNSAAGTSATATTATTTVTAAAPVTSTPGTSSASVATIDALGTTVTVTSTTGYVVGASVSGGGFPQGTTITAITSATTFTTSFASTLATGTAGVSVAPLTISLAAAAVLPTPAAAVAPGNLTETQNANGSTTLTWTAVPGATGYTVTTTETTGAVPPVTLTPVVTPVAPITTAVTGATIDATGKIVTVTSTTGLAVGSYVSGGGFPAGSTITAVTATTFTVSQAAVPVAPATLVAPGTLTVSAVLMTYTTPVLTSGSSFVFQVSATTLSGTTVAASTSLNNGPMLAPVAFTGAADAVGSGSITLQWANNALNAGNVGTLQLSWTGGSTKFLPTSKGATVTGLTAGTSYTFTLSAVSNVTAVKNVSAANTVTVTAP